MNSTRSYPPTFVRIRPRGAGRRPCRLRERSLLEPSQLDTAQVAGIIFDRGPPMSAAASSTEVIVHRDLAAEHVLCDPVRRTLTGIIDWSDIAISDASIDFAGVFHWGGEAFIDAVLF